MRTEAVSSGKTERDKASLAPHRPRPQALIRAVLSSLVFAPCALASDDVSFERGELQVLEDAQNPTFRSGYEFLQPLIDWSRPYFDFKSGFAERTGFSYVIENGLIAQFSPNNSGQQHVDNELNLIGRLDLQFGDGRTVGTTSLIGWHQFSNTLGGRNTSEFQDRLGILVPPNGGDTAPGNANDLTQALFAEQSFLDGRAKLALGKITTRTFMNLNRFAVSDREDFFSPLFVNNPVSLMTARIGLGAYGQIGDQDWFLTGMIRDAGADPSETIDPVGLGHSDWEYALEAGWTPEFDALGSGNYRFLYHYTDAVNGVPSDWDIALSADQDLGARLGALFRYAWSDEGLRTFKQRAVAGLRWKKAFGFANDHAGLGAFWAEPSNGDLDDEYGLETYWVLELAPFFQLSPGAHVNFERALSDAGAPAAIFSLRARLVL